MNGKNATTLLEVRNLAATVAGVEILKGINLTVRAGEVHAIMARARAHSPRCWPGIRRTR
jgi:ABC-type sugar transport system ATPase subunit